MHQSQPIDQRFNCSSLSNFVHMNSIIPYNRYFTQPVPDPTPTLTLTLTISLTLSLLHPAIIQFPSNWAQLRLTKVRLLRLIRSAFINVLTFVKYKIYIMNRIIYVLCALLIVTFAADPVVLFHGIGDQCINSGMNSFTKLLGTSLDTYSVCIQIGNGAMSSIFKSFEEQAKEACDKINNDPKLQGNISVVGLSQGSLLARSIVEECNFKGKVNRYISIGGPQMGVSKFPGCFKGIFCNVINLAIDKQVYHGVVQNNVAPAGYFHDFKHEAKFVQKSHFLSHLNNEAEQTASKYDRLKQINMMLVLFSQDSVIDPKESEWFEYYGADGKIVNFFNTDVYTQDLLPLRQMNDNNQISFIKIEGDHLRFSTADIDNIFVPFLKDEYKIQKRTQ